MKVSWIGYFLVGMTGALFFGFLLFKGNGKPLEDRTYVIARDDVWGPIDMRKREPEITAFADELLIEIGKLSGFKVRIESAQLEELLEGMRSNKFDGILTWQDPTVSLRAQHDLSDPFYWLGPVLVVPFDSENRDLKDFRRRQIAIPDGYRTYYMLILDPLITIIRVGEVSQGLELVAAKQVDGMVLPIVWANAFAQGAYQGQVKVAGPPLDTSGLRLMAPEGHEALIDAFNEGLAAMKKSGEYERLARKWGVYQGVDVDGMVPIFEVSLLYW